MKPEDKRRVVDEALDKIDALGKLARHARSLCEFEEDFDIAVFVGLISKIGKTCENTLRPLTGSVLESASGSGLAQFAEKLQRAMSALGERPNGGEKTEA